MTARAARALLAALDDVGVRLTTKGLDVLVPSGALPRDLRTALSENFGDVHALVAEREDKQAWPLIERAAVRWGWSSADKAGARVAVDKDAAQALKWLRWMGDGGDAMALLVKDSTTTGPRTSARRRQETTR